MNKTVSIAALCAVAATGVLGFGATPSAATLSCDRYASTSGSDNAAGTATSPYRTAQKLLDSLTAGQTGCLEGSFTEDVRVSHSGTTLTSRPGQTATLKGRLWVPDAANDVTVSNLLLDGRSPSNMPSPTINGDRVSFIGNDVTNYHTTICFSIGLTPEEGPYGIAYDTLIEGNRIHGCGRLPATNHDHGIYVEASRNAVIRKNYIYDNADRGVQLFPDAQGTLVEDNVIDGVGEGILFAGGDGLSGVGTYASSNNTVRHNIISNNTVRWLVESNWVAGQPVGQNNQVYENCVWPTNPASYYNLNGGIDVEAPQGFTASSNTVANPLYVDRAGKDFRLQSGSPCAAYGPDSTTVVALPVTPSPTLVAPTNTTVPTISGSLVVGKSFKAAPGTWDSTTPVSMKYDWQRCDKNGANCVATGRQGQAFSLTLADAGHTLRVVETVQNATGKNSARSASSGVVQSKNRAKRLKVLQFGERNHATMRRITQNHGPLRRAIRTRTHSRQ